MLPRITAILFVVALPASHAAAANRYWRSAAGGTFSSTANWSTTSGGSGGASVPVGADFAYFDLNGNYDVSFSTEVFSNTVVVDSGTVTFMSGTTSLRSYSLFDDLFIYGNATLNIGAVNPDRPIWLSVEDRFFIGTNGDGMVVVSGNGSRLGTHGNGTHFLGAGGGTGTLTYQNGSDGTIGPLNIGGGSNVATRGYLNVLSDADLIAENLSVGTNDLDAGATGEVIVSGSGSTLFQTGASTLTVGATSGGNSKISVADGAVFSTGTGLVTLNATGTMNLDGGTINLNGPVTNNGGTFNFSAGALNVAVDLAVGTGGLLSNSVTLTSDHALAVTGMTTIAALRTLTLDGGSLTTGELALDGTLDFRRGTLGITGAGGMAIGAGGPLGATVTIGSEQRLTVTTSLNVAAEGLLLVSGEGGVEAESVGNEGEIELAGSQATLAGRVSNGRLPGHPRRPC